MQKQLLAGVAFSGAFLMAISAFAADPPAPVFAEPPPPAPVAIFYDWSGFYVGGHIGYNWERKKINVPAFEAAELDIEPVHLRMRADGFHGGFQAGFNWQFDQIVVGFEGDFSWTNADDTVTFRFIDDFGPVDDPFTGKQQIKWFGTARARVGWAIDNILVYGTGGFAWKRSELTWTGFFDEGEVFTVSKDAQTHTGWTIGAGAEIGLTENISLKGEWLYMDVGRKTYNLHVVHDDPPTLIHTPTRVKLTEHVVRVGLNWRFVTAPTVPLAPVPAKY